MSSDVKLQILSKAKQRISESRDYRKASVAEERAVEHDWLVMRGLARTYRAFKNPFETKTEASVGSARFFHGQ